MHDLLEIKQLTLVPWALQFDKESIPELYLVLSVQGAVVTRDHVN